MTYIERLVQIGERLESERVLRTGAQVTIVLAEPGAGKTELMKSLATHFGVQRIRASQFRHKTKFSENPVLIIDGVDEVAKIDQSAVDQLIVKAEDLCPDRVFFASRSGQWEHARTIAVKQSFGVEPQIVYLKPLNHDEQRKLFEAYKPDHNYAEFKDGISGLDVGPLLGNPQILKVFADAYTQNGGSFGTKRQVFADAINQLASEHNDELVQSDRTPTSEIIAYVEELFCKLLLSGASGVTLTERKADRDFPYVTALLGAGARGSEAANTGLFKPAETEDQLEPVHRIIAEHAAARYLTRRIDDLNDRLSLRRVMSVIAPNQVARDELRGLLAWMATEGGVSIERAVIDIDPYAIISNGDPSFLSASSKSYLLAKIAEVAELNPHFRGADVWREFSANGFFTDEVVADVEKILTEKPGSDALNSLLLELLTGTSAAEKLTDLLSGILLDNNQGKYQRTRALRVLFKNSNFEIVKTFDELLAEGSHEAMELASELFEFGYDNHFSLNDGSRLLHSITESSFLKGRDTYDEHTSRYFIIPLIRLFDADALVFFLDTLSNGLTCACDSKAFYDCNCRYGRSYLIAKLLDRLVELGGYSLSAEQVWRWLQNVRYPYGRSGNGSLGVSALQSDDELRRAIHRLAFGELDERDAILDLKFSIFSGRGHSGLSFRMGDFKALSDFAFEHDNDLLWSCFIEHHSPYEKDNFQNPYRAHMRKQALEKPAFLKCWTQAQKMWSQQLAEAKPRPWRRSARKRKRDRIQDEIRQKKQTHFDENRLQIEAGQHWGWLELFGRSYLFNSTEHLPDMGDEEFHIRALCNSFDFLKPHIPTLEEIAAERNTFTIVTTAHAACLAHYRRCGTLRGIDRSVLEAVRTDADVSYMVGGSDDLSAFRNELEAELWSTTEQAESFARRYIEPQIADPAREHSDIGWLLHKRQFEPLRGELSVDWMKRYPLMHLNNMRRLFDMVSISCDRIWLETYVDQRLAHLEEESAAAKQSERWTLAHDFWRLRKFFICEKPDEATIEWLSESKERLLALEAATGRLNRDEQSGWKELSADKIGMILRTFVDLWPKVHLPNHWGTGDPPEQTAYRFLTDIVWAIGRDTPRKALPVLDELISDPRFVDFNVSLKSIKANVLKQQALEGFEPPTPELITHMLDNQKISCVEDMRALLIEIFDEIQAWLNGSETDPINQFYDRQKNGTFVRKDENGTTKIIADRLKLRCETLGLNVTIELHQRDDNRTDIGILSNLAGQNALLVIEAKGQWHRELYTAAAEQLDARYSIHPSAARQGIYLVYWFGVETDVAGVKKHGIKSAAELRQKILDNMPTELKARINVVVIDFSR
ncbi:hypothetical protein PUV47_19700 [Pseudovibrio exalbescens]|uniref:hypothetical protein n=1 Tax=Pseudovibrio exalbescens TaxID=197461 RepID=UPI002365F71F|nr:hypothetical protein [Pseudovibrio exalbescens]MDD7912161.1 hypothetical protein [Pseudovibrio exalbescens]